MPERTRGDAERPDVEQSRLRAAADLVVPDPSRSIAALLWLRDAEGAVFDAAPSRVRATVSGGQLSQGLDRVGAGLYELRVAALPGSTSLVIEVFVDDQLFLAHQIPVEAAWEPRGSNDSGCSTVAVPRASGQFAWAQSLVWLALLCRRRRPTSR